MRDPKEQELLDRLQAGDERALARAWPRPTAQRSTSSRSAICATRKTPKKSRRTCCSRCTARSARSAATRRCRPGSTASRSTRRCRGCARRSYQRAQDEERAMALDRRRRR